MEKGHSYTITYRSLSEKEIDERHQRMAERYVIAQKEEDENFVVTKILQKQETPFSHAVAYTMHVVTKDNAADVCKELGIGEPLIMADAPDMVFSKKE